MDQDHDCLAAALAARELERFRCGVCRHRFSGLEDRVIEAPICPACRSVFIQEE